MQEVLNTGKKKIGAVIDLLKEARDSAIKGTGVTDIVGPSGESGHRFNGTIQAQFKFPSSKHYVFEFMNRAFDLDMLLFLDNTNATQPLGNLNNGNGASMWAITLNNTYQIACTVSIDGTLSNNSIGRYRFGVGAQKLPINTWFKMKLRRRKDLTTMDLYIDDALINTVTNVGQFNPLVTNQFCIGTSFDGSFPLSGRIASMVVNPASM